MKINPKMVAFFIVLILIIIVATTATVVSIYYAKDEIKNKGDQNEQEIASSKDLQLYVANSGDWSVEFPKDWYISDDEDSDAVIIKNEPFSKKDSTPSSIRISRGESKIDELIDSYDQALNYETEEITVAGVKGTEISGEVKEGGTSMFQPGTKTRVYLFEIGDNDILSIQTDGDEYINEIDMLVKSLRLNIMSVDTNDKQMASVAVSDSGNIKVYKPVQDEKISSPYAISGEAIAFEGTVNYRLSDSDGNILKEGFMTTIAPDIGQFGDFNQPITFSTSAKEGTLEVFTMSAKDGSEQDMVKIEVVF